MGPSYRTATFSAGAIAVAAGLATSFASSTSPVVVSGGGLNGTLAAALKAGIGPARTVSVSTSASAAAYAVGAGNPIVVTGKRAGLVVVESLLLVTAGGGETIKGVQLFDQITSVAFPAQQTTAGAFTIGCDQVGAPMGGVLAGFRAQADGTVNVQFQDGSTDAVVTVKGTGEPIAAERILSTTAIGLTIFYG